MKITQTSNGLEFSSGAAGQVIFGVIFSIAGLAMAGAYFFVVTGSNKSALLLLAAAAFVGIGLLCLFAAKSTRTLIGTGGEIAIAEKRVLGGSSLKTVSVANIDRVEVQRRITGSTGNGRNSAYESVLGVALKSGGFVDLAAESQNMAYVGAGPVNVSFGVGAVPLQREGEQIAQYLQLPFQVVDGTNLQAVIGNITSAFGEQMAERRNDQSAPASSTVDSQPAVASTEQVLPQSQVPVAPIVPNQSASDITGGAPVESQEDQNVR
jgi:hypothetical protein